MTDDLRYRLGTGPGGPNLEDGLAWAAANDFHFLDFGADHAGKTSVEGVQHAVVAAHHQKLATILMQSREALIPAVCARGAHRANRLRAQRQLRRQLR